MYIFKKPQTTHGDTVYIKNSVCPAFGCVFECRRTLPHGIVSFPGSAQSITRIPRKQQEAPLVAQRGQAGGSREPHAGNDGDYFYINKPRISWSCCSLANENKETIQNQRWVKQKICPISGGGPDNQSDAKTCDRPRGNSKTTKPTACEVCQGARCSCLKISSSALASAFSACRQRGGRGKWESGAGVGVGGSN